MSLLVLNRFSLCSFLFVFVSYLLYSASARPAELNQVEHPPSRPRNALLSPHCEPYSTTFSDPSMVSNANDPNSAASRFVALSPPDTYAITSDGLQLYLKRPEGEVSSDKDGVNNKLGEGATINSTFYADCGKATFEFSVSKCVPGVVGATIMIDATEDCPRGDVCADEIDVEVVGKDPAQWQSNVFAPSKADPEPHFGHFSETHNFNQNPSFRSLHKYSIEWNSEKINWYLDGQDTPARTLLRKNTYIDGVEHFPTHPLRMQMGIWDGSGAHGTSSWSGGPIDWNSAPERIVMTLRSVTLDCSICHQSS
ncbi:concanavalin A-like lectin/glucanase [Gymnopus androsaceus JB14]|uniref:Concanavalin A-like lectin/glucanase n=1 Tax=Gymnopus androsaceus JB14 TaxID=1447944 RepID=A0A6A4I6N9_9AGAR|nr:concanavalin A-like lectin/glucanase [Gymnopus androsaceus JB14]